MESFLQVTYNANTSDFTSIEIKQGSLPLPPPPGMAYIKIAYAAINPIDYMVLEGYMKSIWAMPLPFHPGYDFSGVIAALPEGDSTDFKVGDEVFGVHWGVGRHDSVDHPDQPIGGTFAQYAAIPIRQLSKKPSKLSFELAAAVALVGTTAYQALFDCLKVTAGQKILILGGAGAVGGIAIQLAKHAGAWVATTASTRNLKYISQFGADKVINYQETQWNEDPELEGIHAVFDAVGEQGTFEKSKKILQPAGRFVSIVSAEAGFDPTAHPPLAYASMFGLYNSPAVQDKLAELFLAGKITCNIAETFDFTKEGVVAMFQSAKAAKSHGKNVLRVAT